jgi:hypothetical protein
MRSAGGYSVITEPGKRDVEHDTFSCAHCNAITFTQPGWGKPLQVAVVRVDGSIMMKDAGFCRKCYRHICPRCENKFECTPVEKRLDDEEREWKRSRGGVILP